MAALKRCRPSISPKNSSPLAGSLTSRTRIGCITPRVRTLSTSPLYSSLSFSTVVRNASAFSRILDNGIVANRVFLKLKSKAILPIGLQGTYCRTCFQSTIQRRPQLKAGNDILTIVRSFSTVPFAQRPSVEGSLA